MRVVPFFPRSESRSYCWVIAFAGFLGLLASLGLGRFSLGMMLPGMGAGLGLDYAQMGLISTVNFCGYLVAVLLCGRLSSILGARVLIFLALLLVGASMSLVGLSSSLVVIIVLYCLTGIGSALSNIPIMALISTWFEPGRRGRAAGLCVMGNGLGILLSARLVPALSGTGSDWRLSWLVLGGVVLAIAFCCVLLIRNSRNSSPMKEQGKQQVRSGRLTESLKGKNRKLILRCAAIYFLFGFTYVIYITFMVTSLVQERGLSEQAAGDIWSWVGLISLGSGPLFGYLSDKYGRKFALMLVFSIQTAAYLLVAMKWPMISVYVSVVCYGLVAFSVPTIIAALIGDFTGPQGVASVFGFVTFTFGIGQIAGPAIAGSLAEITTSFSSSFFMASSLTIIAVFLCYGLPAQMDSETS
ncbi:MFS transporter [Desulfosediminicola flagellatus]|uniref:MFS transporter n=1 Tax=Desulfosediminicola flagellatus TaxID=2569541 RepID=UPI0010AD59EB|nr:MFS transporter [Desulfosediminicola flagellatus]